PMDRLQDDVESGDQDDIHCEDREIAGDAQTKEPFVRHDVPGGLRGIVGDNELAAYIELGEDRRRERKQVRESDNGRCFTLGFVGGAAGCCSTHQIRRHYRESLICVGITDRALTRAAPSRAGGRAERPVPRRMVAPKGANCSGRGAVHVARRYATSVPGQRTAPSWVQRRVRWLVFRLKVCTVLGVVHPSGELGSGPSVATVVDLKA